jgi:hypothetical protein
MEGNRVEECLFDGEGEGYPDDAFGFFGQSDDLVARWGIQDGRMQDTGTGMQDARYRMQETASRIRDPGCKMGEPRGFL